MTDLSMTLSSAGNPDFGQYAPLSPEVKISINSNDLDDGLRLMKQYARDYCEEWALGGGNWTNPIVYYGTFPYAYFSYNLRAWKAGTEFPNAEEITVDD